MNAARWNRLVTPRRVLALVTALYAVLGVVYSSVVPVFEAPDEVWHFAYVRELATNRRLPVVDAEGRAPYRHEGLQAPLYYLLGAPLIMWMDEKTLEELPDENPFAQIGTPKLTNDNRNAFVHTQLEDFPYRGTSLAVHMLRLYSLAVGAATIVVTYLLAGEFFPKDRDFYWFYDVLAVIGLIGMIAAVRRGQVPDGRMTLLGLWCILVVLALWRFTSVVLSTQGRLLFPALPAWAVLWSWGMVSLLPARRHAWGAAVLSGALFGIAAIVPFAVISPSYSPAFFTKDTLPATAATTSAGFENGVEWLGASVDKQAVRAGDALKVTLYQRVPAGTPPRQAVFIHVLNSADVIVAQRDSLVGSGNLRPGSSPQLVADAFEIPIPATVPAPGTWRIVAGMYDPATGERSGVRGSGNSPLPDAAMLATIRAEPPAQIGFDFDGRAVLAGIAFDGESVAPGEKLRVNLRWLAPPREGTRTHVFAHALGENDQIWASAHTTLGGQETFLELDFDPATPPGVYPIELGVYDAPDGDRVTVYDARGQVIGDRIFIGPVRVTSR